jgi:hypothetical protein
MILPKGRTKKAPYTRCTTFVSAFEDTYNLEQWKLRQAAIGLSMRRDLQLAVVAHRDDKKKLNAVCKEALDAVASSAAATTGTALHSLTEQMDRGQEVTGVPEANLADLAAYAAATVDLKPVYIEQLVVHDPWQVAGTPDRIVSYKGKRYISDLKTGDIEWGAGKIAAQLAMYARSEVYDIKTGERSIHRAELDKGLVIHLPAGTGQCEVVWIDLLAGWEIARTCRDVRDRRKLKARDLYAPFTEPPLVREVDLAAEIKACTTRDMVDQVWRVYNAKWTDELTAVAVAHIADLEATS